MKTLENFNPECYFYRASAGSGKTYLLTQFFIYLLLRGGDFSFSQILALTFTNKAAKEMKDRILKALNLLRQSEANDPFFKDVLTFLHEKKLYLTASEVQEKATKIFHNILHHYSDFQVATIDKFNHKIVRSFARELDLPYPFQIELNKTEIARLSIQNLLQKIGKNEKITQLFLDFALNNLEENKRWNIENALLSFWKKLNQEIEILTINSDFSPQTRIKILTEIKNFEQQLQNIFNAGESNLNLENLQLAYKGKIREVVFKYFNKIKQLNFENLNCAYLEEENYFTASAKMEKDQNFEKIKNYLENLYQKIQNLFKKDLQNYQTLLCLKNEWFHMALWEELRKEMLILKKEQSLLFIEDLEQAISTIVETEPIPFIYEKIAEKYEHFLIDEFQDTSTKQWKNILPLIENGLSNGGFTLLVGDAKQAIYRFRGGEVQQWTDLLDPSCNKIPFFLQHHRQIFTLENNWRSDSEIVNFNNFIFQELNKNLNINQKKNYTDVVQKLPAKKESGYVYIETEHTETTAEEFSKQTKEKVLKYIQKLLNNNYDYKDLVLLFRSNKKASEYAQYLSANEIPIISAESLLLNFSQNIQGIMHFLTWLWDETDPVAIVGILKFLSKNAFEYQQNIHKYVEKKYKISDFLFENYEINRKDFLENFNLSGLVFKILNALRLDRWNDAYILAFLEEIYLYEQQHGFDLKGFLTFWGQKKLQASIPMDENADAVQIMTFHKSKGLEFSVVILPEFLFFNSKQKDYFFIQNKGIFSEEFSKILLPHQKKYEPLAPELFEQENQASDLDQLNMMYVALTRAKNQLIVFTEFKNHRSYLWSDLWIKAVQQHALFNTETQNLELGVFTAKKIKKPLIKKEFPTFFTQKNPVLTYTQKPSSAQEEGIKTHQLLAKNPIFKEDVLIKFDIPLQWKRFLLELTTHPILENLTALTEIHQEQMIVLKNGNHIIPDLILCWQDRTLVLDYKTGQKNHKHLLQIRHYISVLEEMAFPKVQGALAYLDQETLVLSTEF